MYQNLMPWIPPLHAIWLKIHADYQGDPELDYGPIRLWSLWIAKRNGIAIKEPVPMEIQTILQETFTKIATFVAGHKQYRLYSLDKLEKFFKQEIMLQISQPDPPKQPKKMIL